MKINKTVLDIITFYLEDTNKEETSFNGETITFTLQLVKKTVPFLLNEFSEI